MVHFCSPIFIIKGTISSAVCTKVSMSLNFLVVSEEAFTVNINMNVMDVEECLICNFDIQGLGFNWNNLIISWTFKHNLTGAKFHFCKLFVYLNVYVFELRTSILIILDA